MSPAKQRRRASLVRFMWSLIDAAVWFGAVHLAAWVRLGYSMDFQFQRGVLIFATVAAVSQFVIGHLFGPYAVGHVRGSFEEIVDVAVTTALVAVGIFVWSLFAEPLLVPRGSGLTAGAFALMAMFAVRFIVRAARTRRAIDRDGERRAIIFGAGEAGKRLLSNFAHDDTSGIVPVAVLDDDKRKSRLRVQGLKVRGTRADIAGVARKYNADTLVIALPNADAALLRELFERAADAGLEALSLPPLREIIGGRPTANDLRNLDVADLLGRRPVKLDTTAIAEQLSGRTILVTGAGGSIGSELCRQIARFGPGKLYLLDRDESGLQATQLSLTGRGLLDSDELVLADIRDAEAMQSIFAALKPEVVFHAAALKHLTLLENHPLEAWKSNVLGTLNVLEAAAAADVTTFVNISTDKAANATSVLGYSKRLAERLTADYARRYPGQFVSVRFGNVLGSRGSVVHAFLAQIERGGPITVTHPEVERYFMLIPEACQLVLQAGSIGADGEVMVLEMGEQVKIVEVAKTMIRMSGRKDIDIVYTGLRPGEKLGEELFSGNEGRRETAHPLIDSVDAPPVSAGSVRKIAFDRPSDAANWMRSEATTDLLEDARTSA